MRSNGCPDSSSRFWSFPSLCLTVGALKLPLSLSLSLSLSRARAHPQQHGLYWCTPMNVSSPLSCACVVHLLHPASGLTLSYVASPDTRVDVGTIAAHFSLQPNSLRFNGHFISRDSHFISGLTWRHLLTFFHSRGLNSGSHALDPVEVQGSPLSQPPNEGRGLCAGVITSKFEEGFPCQETPQNAKRAAVQSNLVSPLKRAKQEINSAVPIRSTPPCMLKRGRVEDDLTPSCMWNKRVRHEVNSEVQQGTDEFQLCKDHATCGSKRQASWDDISMERELWERVKEVRV